MKDAMYLSKSSRLLMGVVATLLWGLMGCAKTQDIPKEPEKPFVRLLQNESINSRLLNNAITYKVLLPQNYASSKDSFPVVYLLHGFGDNQSAWIGDGLIQYYADKDFVEPLFTVPTVNPERTFLEKLFLLHEEFHRPTDKMRVDRLSRHLYDIYHLTKAGIAANAINEKELYETIVSHRYKFSRVGEVDYNLHHPNTLNPIPPKEVIADWEADYAKMKEDMIYEENKPGFEELINNLDDLRTLLQALDWQFELKFTIPNS